MDIIEQETMLEDLFEILEYIELDLENFKEIQSDSFDIEVYKNLVKKYKKYENKK